MLLTYTDQKIFLYGSNKIYRTFPFMYVKLHPKNYYKTKMPYNSAYIILNNMLLYLQK